MNIISTAIAIYLIIGLVLGLLVLVAMNVAEKHDCDEYSEANMLMDRIRAISANPKMLLFLMTVIFWPRVFVRKGK